MGLSEFIRLCNRRLSVLRPSASTGLIEIVADGGGTAITVGTVVYLPFPKVGATILAWAMIGDNAAGSTVIDIWNAPYPTVPTVANTITASAKPTLSAAQVGMNEQLPGWTKNIAQGNVLAFSVESNTLNTRVTLALAIRRV